MTEAAHRITTLELIDLGDATVQTRQLLAVPVFIDSMFFQGMLPDL